MTPAPTEEEQASLGLTLEDVAADLVIEVWPDNVTSVNVFISMKDQWRVGPAGPYALDFNVLPLVFQMNGVPAEAQGDVFMDLRVMAAEALKTWKKLYGS
ncbi:MAG TPA: DUF1799 domain-containing protein [Burkholderiaceae bacterium]